MIATKDLSYQTHGKTLLHNISFEIQKGDWLALVGPNGSGKTTLLKILSGLIRDYQGTASLNVLHINGLKPKGLAKTLAVVPQDASFAFSLKALEVVLMGRTPHRSFFSWDSAQDYQAAKVSMQKTDCWSLADRVVSTLSGGELQRVLLARALAQKPKVLLLDEPASHLDLKYQKDLFDLLLNLNQTEKMTLVSVVHDMNHAARYSQKVLVLKEGRQVAFGKTDDVLQAETVSKVFDVIVEEQKSSAGHKIFAVS